MKSIHLVKPYLAERRYIILLGLLSLIIVDFLQLFIPRILKRVIDDLTAFGIDLKGLLMYALYMAGIAILIGVFRYVWRRCLLGTSRRVEEGLRNILFAHLQTLSPAYFDKARTGDLMAHATNDIMQIRMATGMGMVALNDAIVLGSAAIGFMAYINVRLTFFVLLPMPLIVLGTRFFGKKMHRRYQAVQEAFSNLTEVVRERFAGIRIIKAYNREREEALRVDTISRRYIGRNLKLVRITGSFFPMMLLFSNLSLTIVLFLGGRQTITGVITPGDFVAFISYLGLLTWPMMAMGWVTNLIQRGAASLDRLHRILQTPPAIADKPGAKAVKRVRGGIIFENVTFAYGTDSDETGSWPVLSGIDINLEPGKILGVVGPQGSGKTTLLSLVPRLYDVSAGRILIDGMDIREVRIDDLRSQIAFMPQEPFLFAGTVGENIIFHRTEKRDPALMRVVRDAYLYDTIASFQNGLQTVVGEKGVILSGGQKQRIALARALLQKTPILILDDPISQVDTETGAGIVDTIRSTAGRQTVIIVSHRLSAVRFADQIIVLDQGRIAESGSHAALMEADEYYARTFRLQALEEETNAL